MWKVTQHRNPSALQEIKVVMLAKEIAQIDWITSSSGFEYRFESDVKDIKRTNNYEAWMLYKITRRNQKSVELWKLDVKGYYKYKILTIDYQK